MTSLRECTRLNASCLLSKAQEFVPSGISSLDSILGNGYPLGALVLIEEDEFQVYSSVFAEYFLAEGIANRDSLFLADRDNDPFRTIKNLPPSMQTKEAIQELPMDELKIAWRYQNNSVIQSAPSMHKGSCSHDFDFSAKLSSDELDSLDFEIWPPSRKEPLDGCESLLHAVGDRMYSKGLWFGGEVKNPEKKVLRILVKSIGSPFWPEDSVFQTLFKLRTIIHNSSAVAVVTLPTHVLDKKTVNRCEQISDIVISLNSLANSTNKQYSDYSGLLNVLKISPINSLSIHVPDDRDWAFKLRKKKLIIEKLHLPPEASITEQREKDEFVTKPACQFQF